MDQKRVMEGGGQEQDCNFSLLDFLMNIIETHILSLINFTNYSICFGALLGYHLEFTKLYNVRVSYSPMHLCRISYEKNKDFLVKLLLLLNYILFVRACKQKGCSCRSKVQTTICVAAEIELISNLKCIFYSNYTIKTVCIRRQINLFSIEKFKFFPLVHNIELSSIHVV